MKTTFNYDHYFDYQELTEAIHQLQQSYPHLVHIESIAQTPENKQVWVLTLSEQSTLPSHQKPAYYIDATIHAGEVTGMMTAMFTVDYLVSNYGTLDEVTQLLNDYTFYIIPLVSPDGTDAYLNQGEKLRSTNRFYPSETKEDGLHPGDIDGDGVIRMMRFKSKYGAWKISDTDSRIMTKRLPSDVSGDFYHVYPEGSIQNYNGYQVTLAPNKWGLDFNRNFPFGWFSEMRQPGSGKYPLSNVETKAMADFILSHPNIGFVSALHTTGGVLIYPPGTYSEKDAIQSDMKLFHKMGILAKELTGYDTKNIFDEFLVDTDNYSSGAFDDWCYEVQGIPAYTIELWDCLLRAGVPYDQIRATHKSDDQNLDSYVKTVQWVDENLGENGFKPWTSFVHPQLGDIEIGGFDFKFVIQNPPVQFLKQEVTKMGLYLAKSAFSLPKLVIEKTAFKKLADNLFKVDIWVANSGFLSTNLTQKAINQKVNKPVKVEITGIECAGPSFQDLGDLGGFASVNSGYSYDGIQTLGENTQIKKCTFLIHGHEGETLTLNVSHPKAGHVQKTVEII